MPLFPLNKCSHLVPIMFSSNKFQTWSLFKQKIRISSTRDAMQTLSKTFLENDLPHITTCILLMSLSSEENLEAFQNIFIKNIFSKKKTFCKDVEICKRSKNLKCSNPEDFLSPSQKHIG